MQKRIILWAALLVLACTGVPSTPAQVHHLAELNTEQILSLDRERTVVILPGGILEQHGPYLPSYSDGYMNERLTRQLADAVVARPGWKALVFPVIPLGAHAANIIGGQYTFPGSYTLRMSTLRSVFMDLASELGEQGFRWIFVLHLHGAPEHNRALDQAGDYFHDTYGGRMVHLAGLMSVFGALWGTRTEEQQAEEGFTVHAGLEEHSILLFLRPDRVQEPYRQAPAAKSENVAQLVERARAKEWTGYFGSPRLASAAQGAEIWKRFSDAAVGMALRILDGHDPREEPRYADLIGEAPEIEAVNRDALVHDRKRAARQAAWLRERGLE
jgi:creatinine amidohydrolase